MSMSILLTYPVAGAVALGGFAGISRIILGSDRLNETVKVATAAGAVLGVALAALILVNAAFGALATHALIGSLTVGISFFVQSGGDPRFTLFGIFLGATMGTIYGGLVGAGATTHLMITPNGITPVLTI